jgi:4-amino-4-deoxy-L-arabinose transferase-like glycosyltransferase
MKSGRLWSLWFPALVLLVGVALLLCRLDDAYLWQDEAETAIVSRHLLAYGLPLSTDGKDWVQQAGQPFIEFTSDYVWIYHSWLQYGITAVAFAVLGPTTLAARLPFVFFGLATLLFFYHLLRRWLEDRRVAVVGTLLLLFCVPFLLVVRQDRYYALAAFFTLLTLDAYLHLRVGRAWAVPYFVLAAFLLYHSHYGAFFPTLVALGLDFVLTRPERRTVQRFALATVSIAALVLPWAGFMHVLNRGQPFRMDRFLAQVGQYLLYVTGWIVPLALLLVLFYAWARQASGQRRGLDSDQARFCQLAGLIILTNVLVLAASAAFDWVFFRYMVHLIPLLLAMLAIVLVWVMRRWPVAAYALLAVLLVSNGLHLVPYGLPGVRSLTLDRLWPGSPAFQSLHEVWAKVGRFRSDAWMYAQELTHSYIGPNEGLVAYLAAHAQPGQTVVVNYEDLPLMFYTPLRVLGGLGAHGLDGLQAGRADGARGPDWVIDRQYGPYRDRLAALVAAGSYERITLPYPDIRWENRPEPGSHQYLTAQGENPVTLYRRRED